MDNTREVQAKEGWQPESTDTEGPHNPSEESGRGEEGKGRKEERRGKKIQKEKMKMLGLYRRRARDQGAKEKIIVGGEERRVTIQST